MLLIKRFSPYLTGALVFVCFLLMAFFPPLIWFLFALVNLYLVLTVVLFSDQQFDTEILKYFLTPFLLFWSVFLFFLFLENPFARLGVALVSSFLITVYLDQLFFYRFMYERYQAKALENLSLYLAIIITFFVSSSLFGFYIFLHAPRSLLLVGILALNIALNYYIFWILRINFWESLPFIAVLSLASFETFYVMTFLPTSFAVNGAIMAVLYYFALGMIRYHFLQRLEFAVIRRHLVIGLIILISVVATARWT
ncbi:hypothetical protein KJ969_03025 [Patescibacteria group bacterium]|nr:hypothetical protein [Patescibacteria group bacterium]MBU1921942.1 hypothetical protein [Patescibacteria group bacterium]